MRLQYRIDEVVVFHRLTREHLAEIVEIQLARVAQRLGEAGYRLDVTQEAREFLAESGYDPRYGARPLKRAIQRELQDPLAMKILAGDFTPGDSIRAVWAGEGLGFEVGEPVAAAA